MMPLGDLWPPWVTKYTGTTRSWHGWGSTCHGLTPVDMMQGYLQVPLVPTVQASLTLEPPFDETVALWANIMRVYGRILKACLLYKSCSPVLPPARTRRTGTPTRRSENLFSTAILLLLFLTALHFLILAGVCPVSI